MNQFSDILFYLGALQGLLFSVFLFSVKTNRISNKLLALLTLFWAVILLQFPLQEKGLYIDNPHFLKTISNLLFTFFPLLFLHVKYLLSDYKKFEKHDLLHFIPLLLNIIFHINFYLLNGAEKIEILRSKDLYYRAIGIIGDEVIALQGIVYSILIFKRLSRYSKEIKNYHSSVNKRILKILLIGTSLTLFAWLIGTIGVNLDFFNAQIKVDLFKYVYLILVAVIYFISYSSLKTPELYKLKPEETTLPDDTDLSEVSEEKTIKEVADISVTEKTEFQIQLNMLDKYMAQNKPYLDAEICLQDLANKIQLSRHQLSALINNEKDMNFYEFINSYRVEEIKKLMSMPENKAIKLLSLAYDAGFNSKSSFNRIFKQSTGTTPSAYFSSLDKE